jgi:hypothetical protein
MAALPDLSWDIGVDVDGNAHDARRPSVDDVGGATIEDESPFPDKGSMIYADLLNQLQRQSAAQGAVADAARISIHFASGTPVVAGATGPGTEVVTSLFTVTDNGTGDTTITWPAGALPIASPGLQASATINAVGAFCLSAVYVTNGVRVRTYASTSGAAADADFTVNVQ